MKLIYLYGPPGVGKQTVARTLATATGFRNFDNRVISDFVELIFTWGSGTYNRLVEKFRLDLFEEAAKDKVEGLIFTASYVPSQDEAFVKTLIQTLEQHGGTICFAQLVCDATMLAKRVALEEQRTRSQSKTVETLRQTLELNDPFLKIPGRESLTLDNSKLDPAAAAQQIIAHFGLPLAKIVAC